MNPDIHFFKDAASNISAIIWIKFVHNQFIVYETNDGTNTATTAEMPIAPA